MLSHVQCLINHLKCIYPPSFVSGVRVNLVLVTQSWSETDLFLKKDFICLFMVALGLHCFTQSFSSCSEQGYSLVAACDLLIEVASLVAEHGLSSPQALVVAQGLSSCSLWDSRAQAH